MFAGGPKNYSYATALCALFTALELNGTERPFANSSPIKIHVLTAKRQSYMYVAMSVANQYEIVTITRLTNQSVHGCTSFCFISMPVVFCHHLVGKNYCHCAIALKYTSFVSR